MKDLPFAGTSSVTTPTLKAPEGLTLSRPEDPTPEVGIGMVIDSPQVGDWVSYQTQSDDGKVTGLHTGEVVWVGAESTDPDSKIVANVLDDMRYTLFTLPYDSLKKLPFRVGDKVISGPEMVALGMSMEGYVSSMCYGSFVVRLEDNRTYLVPHESAHYFMKAL